MLTTTTTTTTTTTIDSTIGTRKTTLLSGKKSKRFKNIRIVQ
jgi:hypothetical protein